MEVWGIGGLYAGNTKGVVTVTLQSRHQPHQEVHLDAHILGKLTVKLPSSPCSSVSIGSLKQLHLADETFNKPGAIDMIIGADTYWKIILPEIVKSPDHQLVGQRTIFGWTIQGPIATTSCSQKVFSTAVKIPSNEQLHELLQKFWLQEETPTSTNSNMELSPDELECEKHFQETHTRDDIGRYIVRLPLKTSPAALGELKSIALRQLKSVSRRFATDPEYKKLYTDFINEYQTLHHMQRASDAPDPPPTYYLPHHGVLRENSATTKLRVVFNGSSRTTTKISLNDILHTGAKLQVDAMAVLTWLRQYRFIYGTDIVKMFRQIKIHQDDWDLQRILWINEQHEIITYQLTTVTYGLVCSPWLSLRVLQQLVEDEGKRFPLAVPAITKGRYVDDMYGGADTEEKLEEGMHQLKSLCHAGGFELQKWSTNSMKVFQRMELSKETSTVLHLDDSVIRILGLCLHPSTDSFRFNPKTSTTMTFTKRSLLCEIAQTFDPLGFIATIVIKAKILIQELWLLKSNWDDPLPQSYVRRWQDFRQELEELHQLSIPRWIHLSPTNTTIKIHGFADASTVAMGAAVYLRVEEPGQPPSTTLICAKTRVAPLKRMTIPRLELNAALMLTHRTAQTIKTLELKSVNTYLWSDSEVALAWISSHPSRWNDFVHIRVVKIQEVLPTATWNHVSGPDNPADCASRGISTNELINHQLWWSGPEWLSKSPEHWPQSKIQPSPEASIEEKPKPVYPVQHRINNMTRILERYSTFSKVLQVSATITRAIKRFRRQPVEDSPILTQRELHEAKIFWITLTQQQYFHPVLQRLNQGGHLQKATHWQSLHQY